MSSSSLPPSHSVPSSPAVMRSAKEHPVTPHRRTAHRPAHSHSFYVAGAARSPLTPSSPYTPLSLRSADTSSTLTTPDSFVLSAGGTKRRLAFDPEVVLRGVAPAMGKDHRLADIAENWRSRASENGIKVSSTRPGLDESHYEDDASMSDANDSGLLSADDILLPAAFLSTHRRTNSDAITARSRMPTTQVPRPQPISPTILRNVRGPPPNESPVRPRRTLASLNQSMNVLATPPPNRALASQLKLKGSFTDPAQPRRREAFGVIHTPGQNANLGNRSMNLHAHQNMNMSMNYDASSLDLFDIDENDYEYQQEASFDLGSTLQARNTTNTHTHITANTNTNMNNNSNSNYGYPTYTQPQPAFADPFLGLGIEQHFHQQQQQRRVEEQHHQQQQEMHFARLGLAMPQAQRAYAPTYVPHAPVPMPMSMPVPFQHSSLPQAFPSPTITVPASPLPSSPPAAPSPVPQNPKACSVCLAPHPTTLAILQPCAHPLCSGCLTSALNIVGEKDMECAVCRRGVRDFRLVVGGGGKGESGSVAGDEDGKTEEKEKEMEGEQEKSGKSPGSSLLGSPGTASACELESPFEFGLDFGEMPRASTPRLEQQQASRAGSPNVFATRVSGRGARKGEESVVLRIDNVPWDITPLQITRWLQQPVARVHVLLDPKGKTLSHAYVEVSDARVAGAILRGEAAAGGVRGSVLGRGRRARGVTVTRSGQQELMADLFPNWRGSFDGSRPSLMGLDGDRIIGALEGGLLSENELAGLLHLIKEPDSHFLKVPVLPFHSLIGILSKFPADVDSRVFWSTAVRDKLFDVAYFAVQALLLRVEQTQKTNHEDEEHTMDLVRDLAWTALDCQAFTAQQVRQLTSLLEASSIELPPSSSRLRNDEPASSASTSMASTSTIAAPGSSSGSRAFGPRAPASPVFSHYPHPQYKVIAPVGAGEPFHDLAREFGVEAQLVHALAQRLAGAGLC